MISLKEMKANAVTGRQERLDIDRLFLLQKSRGQNAPAFFISIYIKKKGQENERDFHEH